MLADPLRVRIVELLAYETICKCHLVEATGARQSTVSRHGPRDHRIRSLDEPLVVAVEAPTLGGPREGAFYDPAARQRLGAAPASRFAG